MATTNEILSRRNRKNKNKLQTTPAPSRLHRIEEMNTVFSEIFEEDILQNVLKSDLENLKQTLEEADKASFQMAVDMILKARRIYIVGVRSCEPLAVFLGYYLNLMFEEVKVLCMNSAGELFEQLFRIDEQDILIGISYPRYSMRTLKAMEYAADRNAKVIAVTDSIYSPMKLYATCTLTAKSEMSSVVDSLTAPMSMMNALVIALSMRKQSEMAASLSTLERVWEEYQVYNNDEINYIDNHIEVHFSEPKKKRETGKGETK